MRLFKLYLVFVLFNSTFVKGNCLNVLHKKLEKLLDFCLQHTEHVDSGTILGVLFAKGQLQRSLHGLKGEILVRKCEELEQKFLESRKPLNVATEIGKKKMILFGLLIYPNIFSAQADSQTNNIASEISPKNWNASTRSHPH